MISEVRVEVIFTVFAKFKSQHFDFVTINHAGIATELTEKEGTDKKATVSSGEAEVAMKSEARERCGVYWPASGRTIRPCRFTITRWSCGSGTKRMTARQCA